MHQSVERNIANNIIIIIIIRTITKCYNLILLTIIIIIIFIIQLAITYLYGIPWIYQADIYIPELINSYLSHDYIFRQNYTN